MSFNSEIIVDKNEVSKQTEQMVEKNVSNDRQMKDWFECDLCHRFFTRKTSLNEHKYIHSDLKPFECEVCGKCFRQTSNYYKHLKLHQKKNSQSMVSTDDLNGLNGRSQSSDLSDQSLVCKLCGRQFITRSYLRSHLLSHNQFKSCLCDRCGHTFKYRCDLIRHLKIHDNQRPHKCNVCHSAFNDISALKRHSIKVHKSFVNSSKQTSISELTIESNMNSDKSEKRDQLVNESMDLNDSNYLNSVIDYINVCRILPVPLPNHIFEKSVELQKEIAIHLGIDNKCEKQFHSILRTSLQDLNTIISEHLKFKYKIIQ